MPDWLNRFMRAVGAPPIMTLRMHGLEVLVENTRPDIRTEDVLARLDESLALIQATQPWRLSHLRRDLNQIRVVRYPCRGAFIPADRACITELTFLARRDITAATVASSIIHEGIHARVHAMTRVRAWDMAREERLCRRAEVEFGRALPSSLGRPVIERAMDALTLADQEVAPVIDWEEAVNRQESIDREARG
jgi:hypothetical protein